MTNIEKQIAARIVEAEKKRIFQKARSILNNIGEKGYMRGSTSIIASAESSFISRSNLVIYTDCSEIIIKVGGHDQLEVFRGKDNCVFLFVPGVWEKTFKQLFKLAPKIHSQREREARKREAKENARRAEEQECELRAKWKLLLNFKGAHES